MSDEKLRVIITGATGMVGEGVLHECLQHPSVEAVLVLGRMPLGRTHPKLQEVVLPDLFELPGGGPGPGPAPVESRLSGYNACFYCLGVSSVGMEAGEYYRVTYTLTLQVAECLSRLNPAMTFIYVSGAGTDSSEKGRSRWARVKGKTENDLRNLSFRQVYAFRPGFIRPTPGLSNAHRVYRYVDWLFPIGRALYPNGFVTLREVGLSMINLALRRDGSDARDRRNAHDPRDSPNPRNGNPIINGKAIIRLAAS